MVILLQLVVKLCVLLASAAVLVSCVRSASTHPKAADSAKPSPVVVALLGGFMAPRELYGPFEAAARESGAEVIHFSFPDGTEALELTKQDSMLRRVASKLAQVIEQQRSDGAEPRLFVFGHSIGGKLAAHLAMASEILDGSKPSRTDTDQATRRDLQVVQHSLGGVFLLDPVEAGMDAQLTTRIDDFIAKRLSQSWSAGVHNALGASPLLAGLDASMVRLRTELLRPVGNEQSDDGRNHPRIMVVRSDKGDARKSVEELTRTVQLLRLPANNAFIHAFRATERAGALAIDNLGLRAIPSCAPSWYDQETRTSSAGPAIFYEMMSRRQPLPDILGSSAKENMNPAGAAKSVREVVTLDELGLGADKRFRMTVGGYGSRPWSEIAAGQPGLVVINDSGHMDLVDLQPYRNLSHIKFVLACPVGEGFLEAMQQAVVSRGASFGESSGLPWGGRVINPTAQAARDLWDGFLRVSMESR